MQGHLPRFAVDASAMFETDARTRGGDRDRRGLAHGHVARTLRAVHAVTDAHAVSVVTHELLMRHGPGEVLHVHGRGRTEERLHILEAATGAQKYPPSLWQRE